MDLSKLWTEEEDKILIETYCKDYELYKDFKKEILKLLPKRTWIAITQSLDRIDSKKGYIEGNVHWIHKRINVLKRDYPEEEFFEFVTDIAKYRNLVHCEGCNCEISTCRH